MIYGHSYTRRVEDPDFDCGSGVCRMHWKPALGRRSRRHQLRMQDAWRITWWTEEAIWPLALHVITGRWVCPLTEADLRGLFEG